MTNNELASCFGMNAGSFFLLKHSLSGHSYFWFKFCCIRRKWCGNHCMRDLSICQIWKSEKWCCRKPGLRFKKDRIPCTIGDGRTEWAERQTFQFELEEQTETDYNWCRCAFVTGKNDNHQEEADSTHLCWFVNECMEKRRCQRTG